GPRRAVPGVAAPVPPARRRRGRGARGGAARGGRTAHPVTQAPDAAPVAAPDAAPVALVVSAPRARGARWLGMLAALEGTGLEVVVVTRDAAAARDLRACTGLPVRRARTTDELAQLLDSLDTRVVVYPEQHRRNFQ